MSEKQLYANNAESKLLADISGAAVTFDVLSGDGAKFPAPTNPGDFFLVTLTDGPDETKWEIVKVTSRTGDTFDTVVRGQEGTAAIAWIAEFTNVSGRLTRDTVQNFFNKTVTNTEHIESAVSAAAALELDIGQSNNYTVELFENVTGVTFTNIPAGPALTPITIEFTQDVTGGWTVTGWPAGVKWPAGVAPVITSAADSVDVIAGYTRDGGTNIRLARAMEDSQ